MPSPARAGLCAGPLAVSLCCSRVAACPLRCTALAAASTKLARDVQRSSIAGCNPGTAHRPDLPEGLVEACREGCAGKGQAATLEQQRLPARGLGGSCREEAVQQLEVEAAARELEGFKGFKRLKPGKRQA